VRGGERETGRSSIPRRNKKRAKKGKLFAEKKPERSRKQTKEKERESVAQREKRQLPGRQEGSISRGSGRKELNKGKIQIAKKLQKRIGRNTEGGAPKNKKTGLKEKRLTRTGKACKGQGRRKGVQDHIFK